MIAAPLPGRFAALILAGLGLFTLATASAEERLNFKTAEGDTIEAIYYPPPTDAPKPSPAIIMLHGCGGLFTKSGKISSREKSWIALFQKAGWAVLLPDSFGSRGYGSLCQTRDRPVKPEKQRIYDTLGALELLHRNPDIDAERIALAGWSNGAMAGLHALRDGSPAAPPKGTKDFRTAVVFYPGCIALKKSHPDYRPRVPTLIQIGALDDWTLAKPCQALVEDVTRRGDSPPMYIDAYPDAYHG
ncbi:MAG: prolyl oligopeptidase family serine peptidase, partial [Rhodospirillales bacterium]